MVFRRQIGKRQFGSGVRSHKTNQVIKDRVGRFIRRQMIRDGLILNPATRPPRYEFSWTLGEVTGIVYADDKSKARSLIKKDLGIPAKKRLPFGIQIIRASNIDFQKALNQTYVNLQASA
jgi:hypothetical protein